MWANVILLILLLICVVTDLRERKIYNNIIFPTLIISIMFHLILGGLSGLGFSLLGFIVGLGVLLIPYLMGGMGAGDVKLLAVIGALKGTAFVLNTALYMALIGGILALGIILFRKGMLKRLKSIIYTICGFRYGLKIPLTIGKDALTTTYPYGVAIAGGAILCLTIQGWVIL